MATFEDRCAATTAMLLSAARESGMFVSGDARVSESDLALLLGLHPGTLKAMRTEGGGPAAFHVGLNGSRWSYALRDVGEWIEARRLEGG